MHTSWTSITCILITLLHFVAPAFGQQQPFRIVGYLPDYRTFDEQVVAQLTDLYLFSAEPMASGEIHLERFLKFDWKRISAWNTAEQKCKVYLCIGGWERSKQFPTLAASATKRKLFARTARLLCQEKRLAGIDLDWEHPQTAADHENYGLLLQEIRQEFTPHQLKLTVTVAGWQKLSPLAIASVEGVQLMAYDHPGQHATEASAHKDIQQLLEIGVPPNKLTLGLPFYGRHVNQPAQTLTYAEIVAKYRPAAKIDEVDGYYFNGRDTIVKKVEQARRRGLAGVMIWEISQDAPGEASLLRLIRRSVRGR